MEALEALQELAELAVPVITYIEIGMSVAYLVSKLSDSGILVIGIIVCNDL